MNQETELKQNLLTLNIEKESLNRMGKGLSATAEQEVLSIEKDLDKIRSEKLHEEFFASHNWNKKHLANAKATDMIFDKNTLLRVKEIYTTSFNEGSDTYNFRAKALNVFSGEELQFDFGYYDVVDFLEL